MARRTTRRRFLASTLLGGAGLWVLADARAALGTAASSKLRVALVGVGGRGRWFVDTIPRMERVVTLCDVNDLKVADAYGRWKDLAERFAASEHGWERSAAPELQRLLREKVAEHRDFRRMLDAMHKDIDAVIVAVPDHTHAVISAAAIRAGKPVFCEKPLTRTVRESRALRDLARTHGVATSMGNQGTASGPFRRALELIRAGAIGEVREVHVWNTGGGADRKEPPRGEEPIPSTFQWDLWLGPAAARPYRHEWLQRNSWRDFGTCQLGNWASHSANLAFMALRVHELWNPAPDGERAPRIRVEATYSGVNRLSFPEWETVTWSVPERAGLPAIPFRWYNGNAPGAQDRIRRLISDSGDEPHEGGLDHAGAVIVGTKGRIHSTGHNATFRLLPTARFEGVSRDRPESVDSSRGHEMDWLLACRGGKPAWASFDYAGPLNEFLMLGNVATQIEGAFTFEPASCRVIDHAAADELLGSEYRSGWSLTL